jgi:hypothetical protein
MPRVHNVTSLPSRHICVFGLSPETRCVAVRRAFTQFGTVQSVESVEGAAIDGELVGKRGLAFVEFALLESAQAAVAHAGVEVQLLPPATRRVCALPLTAALRRWTGAAATAASSGGRTNCGSSPTR